MKIKKISIIFVLLPILFLSGCFNEKKNDTFRTVEYYDTHPKERDTRLKECKNLVDITENVMRDCGNADTSYSSTKSPIYTPTKRH